MFAVLRPVIARSLGPIHKSGLPYRAYVVVKWLAQNAVMDYVLTAFCLLDAHRGLAVWASWGYVGHLLPAALWAALTLLQLVLPRPPRSGGGGGGKHHHKSQ
jgi:hypothetical protein